MIVLTPPAEFTGEGIRQDLIAVGFLHAEVVLVGGELHITGVDDETTAAAVVAAHVPDVAEPVPPIEARLAALEETVDLLLNGGLG